MKLSVVIPVYNERNTLEDILRAVQADPTDKEILLVDDGSTDGTRDLLGEIGPREPNVRVLLHERNRGKGAALRTGFAEARGEIVLVQDADLEYDPTDYPALLEPILAGRADVVYGSRFSRGRSRRVGGFWHARINGGLTWLSNALCDLDLTDMETCYKVFRREIIQAIDLRENRFGIEPEITAKLAAVGVRFWEVPIRYNPRGYEAGKKIGFTDGLRALWCILNYNLRKRFYRRAYRKRLADLGAE